MVNISKEYVSNAVDELIVLLGVKEDIPLDDVIRLARAGLFEICVENLAKYMGLPIKINVVYVPDHQQGQSSSRFDSTALTNFDPTGKRTESITAQVLIPGNLPFYGSTELNNFPITVKISKNCKYYPQSFLCIMAHELTHVVMHSLRHTKRDNEIYTDSAAMILGFSNVYRVGRKVVETKENAFTKETLTTTYGYLSDDNYDYVFKKIRNIKKNI